MTGRRQHPRCNKVILPDGSTVQDILDRVAQQPEPRGTIAFCTCGGSWCCICGADIDTEEPHVRLDVESHHPRFTTPGRGGPLCAHARCWHAVLDHSLEQRNRRLFGP